MNILVRRDLIGACKTQSTTIWHHLKSQKVFEIRQAVPLLHKNKKNIKKLAHVPCQNVLLITVTSTVQNYASIKN